MNKPLIITIAVGILILALGSWLYLFLFGAPQSSDELFADLGITPRSEQATNPIPQDSTDTEVSRVDTSSDEVLRQLTLRPVAGYQAFDDTVRYVEQGTGHVYEIDLNTGVEVRLSNTTVPTVTTATFNSDGSAALFISERVGQRSVVLGTLGEGALTTRELPPQAKNATFVTLNTIRYTLTEAAQTIGYEYDRVTETQQEIFRIPLRDITTTFLDSRTYVVPKPATELEGAIFVAQNESLTQVGVSRFGLSAVFGESWYGRTYNANDEVYSDLVSTETNTVYDSPVIVVPEKCDWVLDTLYCAAPLSYPNHTYIEDWYKGIIRSEDALWRVNPQTETAVLLADPATDIGRPLDITQTSAFLGDVLFFTNRLDNTLWMHDPATN